MNISARGLVADFLITTVETTDLGGKYLRYKITAIEGGTVAGAAVPAAGAVHGGGHAACIASFIASLRGGPARADLATACRSTMLAVMARTAVATGAPVAWHDLWQAAPALRSARPLQSSRV